MAEKIDLRKTYKGLYAAKAEPALGDLRFDRRPASA